MLHDTELVAEQEYFDVFLWVRQTPRGEQIKEQPEDVHERVDKRAHGPSISRMLCLHKPLRAPDAYLHTTGYDSQDVERLQSRALSDR